MQKKSAKAKKAPAQKAKTGAKNTAKKTASSEKKLAQKPKPRAKKIEKEPAPPKDKPAAATPPPQDKEAAPTAPPPQDIEPALSFIKEKLLNTQDVCTLLGISLRTLYSYLKEGLLPFFRIRRRIWFLERELAMALKKFWRVQG